MNKLFKTNTKKFFVNHKDMIINYAVLIIGCLACCFTKFHFNMWFCSLIYPACFLFFARREKKAYIGLPAVFAAAIIGAGISSWTNFISAGVGYQILIAVVTALLIFIPYVLDRLVYTRFFSNRPFVLSFLFPLTWVTLDIIVGFTPIGCPLSISYSLCQIMAATTVASFLGVHFLTFVMIYFASAIASFAIAPKANIKALITTFSLIGFSLAYSGIYNVVPNPYNTSLKVMTGYSTNDTHTFNRKKLTQAENEAWLATDVTAAKADNVEMLVYPEEAFWLTNSEATSFETFLKAQASNNNLYIITGVNVSDEDQEENIRNEAWIALPDGTMLTYVKSHLVPVEEEGFIQGTGDIKYFDIPNKGRVGVVICFDLEFEQFITKVGRLNCDTLIAPSWDWLTMYKEHSRTTCFRAIENGVNMLRCTDEGWSVACDFKGNIITQYYEEAEMPERTSHANHVFYMPMTSRKTPYRYLGLFINYLYPVALASLLITFGVLNKKQPKKTKKNR